MAKAAHLKNRKWLVSQLRAEIVGPEPVGEKVAIYPGMAPVSFSWEDFRKPRQQLNGEEILGQDPPAKRYGAGILYPTEVNDEFENTRINEELDNDTEQNFDSECSVDERLEAAAEKKASKTSASMDDSDDYAVSLANAFKPSAIGLSFLCDFSFEKIGLKLEIVNVGRVDNDEVRETPVGNYRKYSCFVGDSVEGKNAKTMWLRVPLLNESGVYPTVELARENLLTKTKPIRIKLTGIAEGLEFVIVSRGGYPTMSINQRLVTISLVNRKKLDQKSIDEQCFFQSGFRVKGISEAKSIRPYPEVGRDETKTLDSLSEDNINRLIYRQHQTFAIGHGCAADWDSGSHASVSEIWTEILPTFETPTTSADLFVKKTDGSMEPLKVSMRKLAGLDPLDSGMAELDALLVAYEDWIEALRSPRMNVPVVPSELKDTSEGLIKRCEECLERMRDGIALLNHSSEASASARKAFALANHAMLIAQLRSSRDVREPVFDADGYYSWSPKIENVDPAIPNPKRGYWRAFQIAFLLMSLRGIVEPSRDIREVVDLIWFPTGGGKTEAYLGLTSFTIFFNHLSGRNSGGADVLMRYTLRLLTVQQFQRAALLFCAMEHLRKKNEILGEKRFRIGLWVGGSSTPNKRDDALSALKNLNNPEKENPFVLLKCPWCSAKFGLVENDHEATKSKFKKSKKDERNLLFGYKKFKATPTSSVTVVFRCGDESCEFGGTDSSPNTLPIVIIDEDLLEDPTNLIIGTVDKFALLAWKPEVRRIFGIGRDGKHFGLPPSLIIQDELHLISGPLGSMVGAYETVIEQLCQRNGLVGEIKPKIIASTATISRSSEQILNLYARPNVFLFPPSGLEAGDSFFAKEARNEDGSLEPGRLYVGLLAPAHGSLQTTEARVFANLMQHAAIMETDDAGRDPWWTLLCFFNSIRELGSAASLFVSDTRDYLNVILDRKGIKRDQVIRQLWNVTELTSRIRGDLVPKELERLEKKYSTKILNGQKNEVNRETVDACLASNIIEVGVDITRLSLMAIVGQPKTTSQYIQVSSRVGRDPEKPGLVVVLYGQSKPRDRSHYERFRPYHQRLYAEVEPTSVTPFSPPAVDRALHGLIVSMVRQLGLQDSESINPDPFPLTLGNRMRERIEEIIENRVNIVAKGEFDDVLVKMKSRFDEWKFWQPTRYGDFAPAQEDPPLIHPAGSTVPASWGNPCLSWPTLSSLRDVDASCEAEITRFFNKVKEE